MIKSIIAIVLSFLFCLVILQKDIYAHSRGIPILTINGKLTKVYPIESSSIEPYLGDSSDIASENYLVKQKLDFAFDASRSAEIPIINDWNKITYTWNFGDGTKEQKTNTPTSSHTYTKMGSFIMQLTADFSKAGSDSPPQVVQTTLIHILPNRDYKLPHPVIKINGQRVSNKETVEFDFNKRLSFDASDSRSLSSKIIQYQWDLGQGEVVKNSTTAYRYKLPQYYTTVVLRVMDENGFIVEDFVDLENSGSNEPSEFSLTDIFSNKLLIALLVQALVLGIGIVWFIQFKKKKKGT